MLNDPWDINNQTIKFPRLTKNLFTNRIKGFYTKAGRLPEIVLINPKDKENLLKAADEFITYGNSDLSNTSIFFKHGIILIELVASENVDLGKWKFF